IAEDDGSRTTDNAPRSNGSCARGQSVVTDRALKVRRCRQSNRLIRTSVDEWGLVARIDNSQSETLRIESATRICNFHDHAVWTNLIDAGVPRDQSRRGVDLHAVGRGRQTVDELLVIRVNSLHLIGVLAIGSQANAGGKPEVCLSRVTFGEE